MAVQRTSRGAGLGLQHERAGEEPGAPARAVPGDRLVESGPAVRSGQEQRGAPVAGFQYWFQWSGRDIADGCRERVVDVFESLGRDPAAVPHVIWNAVLDGGFAAAFRFHFQEAGGAVHVGPGADLEAPAPAPGRQHVAVQLWGVEVDGVVVKRPFSVHLQDSEVSVEGRQQLLALLGRDDVFAVYPGLQRRGGVQFLQPDCGQVPEVAGNAGAHAAPAVVGASWCRGSSSRVPGLAAALGRTLRGAPPGRYA
ncbi:hypothetical protein SRABI26_02321 [Arthrobacter sp. Bi26]|nr:hypothetical protein SRABI26_02321 [Arthrobacter sp. Bi26]